MKEGKLNINLVIADRAYPLKIEADEEAVVRKAAKMVNEKMKDFKKKYDVRDKQDYLAMVVLMQAVDNLKNESKAEIDKTVMERADELDNILSDFLKEK